MVGLVPKTFIGLDLGGTNIKVLAFNADGAVIAEGGMSTVDDGTGVWLDRARTVVLAVMAKCPSPAVVGVAAPGLPSRDGRSIAFMPGRLAGLEGLNWQKWLELESPVPVLNDARAALLGEIWLGAAKGATNVVLLTLGTGVGGAAMVDGRILRGHINRAGHLGHVSLDPNGALDITNTPGSLEDAIGECSLAARCGRRFASTRDLVAAYRQGAPEAAEIWLRSVRALAAAVAGLINVLDPELVVIGGGIADADEALFEPLRRALDDFEWRPGGARVRLAKAALGRTAGASGAAYAAKLMAADPTQPIGTVPPT
ncbi:MAG: ROK family protein [Verrucomicrobia bacterium]|nr:ROK family protein [Verrucomicrobiota bacterium]